MDKAEMMREFHIIMHVTCEYCKYDATGNGDTRYCEQDGSMVDKDGYCQAWEEKDDEINR